MEASIRSPNAAEVAAHLRALADRLENPAPALERLRVLFSAQEAQVWETEGAPFGTHWPAAAESTRSDGALLVATGRLRASLVEPDAGNLESATELRLGTDVPYAHFHQYGTRNMPARQITGLSLELAAAATDLYEQALAETLPPT